MDAGVIDRDEGWLNSEGFADSIGGEDFVSGSAGDHASMIEQDDFFPQSARPD